jgi:hypothetical protein
MSATHAVFTGLYSRLVATKLVHISPRRYKYYAEGSSLTREKESYTTPAVAHHAQLHVMLPESRSTYRYRQEKAAADPVGALSRWVEVLHTGPVLRCPACRRRHLHVD